MMMTVDNFPCQASSVCRSIGLDRSMPCAGNLKKASVTGFRISVSWGGKDTADAGESRPRGAKHQHLSKVSHRFHVDCLEERCLNGLV